MESALCEVACEQKSWFEDCQCKGLANTSVIRIRNYAIIVVVIFYTWYKFEQWHIRFDFSMYAYGFSVPQMLEFCLFT